MNRKIDGLACALRSLETANERGRIARLAALRYIFEAVSEGVPIEEIIERTGFQQRPQTRYAYMFDYPSNPQHAFADWAADQFRDLLKEMADTSGG